MSLSSLAVRALVSGLLILWADMLSAQDYPYRPIRIVTAPAGTGSDLDARTVAQGISGPLGQPVIVDNRVTLTAIEVVVKAPAEGYTLLVNGASVWTIPLLQKASYDPAKDLSPISLISRSVNAIAVHPSVPANSIRELIALAKANPGKLNFSSGATGQGSHIAAELFKSMADVNMVTVPYNSTTAATTALIAGEVQVMVMDASLLAPFAKAGKLKALAVTSAQPSALFQGLPTVAATGVPGYEAVSMTGIWAPAKTPLPVINRLNQEIVRALNLPEVKERFLKTGLESAASTPEQFAATLRSEMAKITRVVKDAGIRPN